MDLFQAPQGHIKDYVHRALQQVHTSFCTNKPFEASESNTRPSVLTVVA